MLWEVLVQVFPYPNIPEIMVLLGVAKGLVSLPLPDTFPADFRKLLQSELSACLVRLLTLPSGLLTLPSAPIDAA